MLCIRTDHERVDRAGSPVGADRLNPFGNDLVQRRTPGLRGYRSQVGRNGSYMLASGWLEGPLLLDTRRRGSAGEGPEPYLVIMTHAIEQGPSHFPRKNSLS